MGGNGGSRVGSSTEQYSPGDESWSESITLPQPLTGPRATNLEGTVYLTGEIIVRNECP